MERLHVPPAAKAVSLCGPVSVAKGGGDDGRGCLQDELAQSGGARRKGAQLDDVVQRRETCAARSPRSTSQRSSSP